MPTLQQLISESDRWTMAEGTTDGLPFLLRFRPHLQDFIATSKYTKRLTILWPYEPGDDSSMPAADEMQLMEEVENALVDKLESDTQCVLAFVYTGQNQREWHWYTSDISETGKRINDALADFDALPIELSVEDDPDWDEYQAVLNGAVANEEE